MRAMWKKFSHNASTFHVTWLDAFWADLVFSGIEALFLTCKKGDFRIYKNYFLSLQHLAFKSVLLRIKKKKTFV